MTLILIPCKDLDFGKSRLSSVIDDASRRRLCEQFLSQTLIAAAGCAGAPRIRIVSSDVRVWGIARPLGGKVIADAGGGLNAALTQARESILHESLNERCIVLPIDLPYVSVSSLNRIMAAPGEIVIVPAGRGGGTNVLGLAPATFDRFPFMFGANSFTRHAEAARALGVEPTVVSDPDLGFDVDEPEDYREWMRGLAVRGVLIK
jgi:2-phospho-L-lactate guanylyltransferase